MTEEQARAWFVEQFGSARTERVAAFLGLVTEENARQNLISPTTVDTIWTRHGVDSAQLMFHVKHPGLPWLDVGTGGGFPGVVVAILTDGPVVMSEPRRKRVEFLQHCIERFSLTNAIALGQKVEAVDGAFATISARAVASVEKLLQAAEHCATPETRWILPRGQIDEEQIDLLRRDQSRVFHVEQSLTDPASSILIVERKGARSQ